MRGAVCAIVRACGSDDARPRRRHVLAAEVLLALLGSAGLATAATAQPPPDTGRAAAPRAPRGARDPGPRDSAGGTRPLVEWSEPDSVMRALMSRPGYEVTRYQGESATVDASARTVELRGDGAAVAQDETVVRGDTIRYDARSDVVRVRGDTIVVRDPARSPNDLVGLGELAYDIAGGRAVLGGARFAVESGETWFVEAERAAVVHPDDGRPATLYGLDASVTSCELHPPHYHVHARRLKIVAGRLLVARSAVLYVGRVPVLWLPVIVQDLRAGRRSGLLTPRIGVSDVLRSDATYQRRVENVGYFFALGDYTDARISLDWRSGARAGAEDPGWSRYNAEWRYRWLDRSLSGRVAGSYLVQQGGRRNTSLSWAHQQELSGARRLAVDVNYTASTALQRSTAIHPYHALAVIQSQVNYSQPVGPARIALGGSRRQYPGRPQVDQELPSVNVVTRPISLGSSVVWTPTFRASATRSTAIETAGGEPIFRFVRERGAVIDSVRLRGDQRGFHVSLDTPLQLGGFTWHNSVRVVDRRADLVRPDTSGAARAGRDGSAASARPAGMLAREHVTSLDWQTGIVLPTLSPGRWNLTPSVQIANVDPAGLWVRSERTGGRFVGQRKRVELGLVAAPTLFAFYPGFGPFARLRHSVTPVVGYTYAPSARLGDDFLAATGRTRDGYVGARAQQRLSLSLSTALEARLRGADTSAAPTSPVGRDKLSLLSLTASAIAYDVERARRTGRAGLVTEHLELAARSDLLPGFDLSARYSLFAGSTLTDTASFHPFLEELQLGLSLGALANPFAAVERLFGRPIPIAERPIDPLAAEDSAGRAVTGTWMDAGRGRGEAQATGGVPWNAAFALSVSRRRAGRCGPSCDAMQRPPTLGGTPAIHFAPSALGTERALVTLQSRLGFALTRNWGVQWLSMFDFRARRFASHVVGLHRELHDWQADFGFTRSQNGNLAFSVALSLRVRPEVGLDYDRQVIRTLHDPGR